MNIILHAYSLALEVFVPCMRQVYRIEDQPMRRFVLRHAAEWGLQRYAFHRPALKNFVGACSPCGFLWFGLSLAGPTLASFDLRLRSSKSSTDQTMSPVGSLSNFAHIWTVGTDHLIPGWHIICKIFGWKLSYGDASARSWTLMC